MVKKVLFVALGAFVTLALFGLVFSEVTGESSADVLGELEKVETYKWYPAQAEQIYEEIAKVYPASNYALEAYRNLVISYISAKRADDAQQALDKLTVDFTGHSELAGALYDVARIYEQSRKYEDSNSIYQQIIQKYPDSSSADKAQISVRRIEVLSHIESKDDYGAAAALDGLVADFNDHSDLPESIYNITRRYERAKKYKKAKELYQQIIEQYPASTAAERAHLGIERADICSLIRSGSSNATEAIDSLIADFNDHPDLSEALYGIAIRYEKAKQYEQAESVFQQIIDQFPDSSHAARAQLLVPKLNIFSLIESGDIEPAHLAVNKLLADFSGHSYLPAVLCEIARRFEKSEEYEQAGNIYQQITRQYPGTFYADKAEMNIPKNGVVVLIDAGEISVAQEAVDNLIVDFNDHPRLPATLSFIAGRYCRKASFLLMENNNELDEQARDCLEKAAATFEMIIAKFPQSTSVAEWYRIAGDCYRKLADYGKSIQYYQKVVDDYSGYYLVYHAQYFIGRCLEALRDSNSLPEPEANQQIKQAYRIIVEKYPDCRWFGYACEELGWLNFRERQWAHAVWYFELYLSRYPDSEGMEHILYVLGWAYEQMGDLDKAVEVYSEFIVVAEPNDSRIEKLKAKLKQLENQDR